MNPACPRYVCSACTRKGGEYRRIKPKPRAGQQPCSRRYHAPAAIRNCTNKIRRAGHHDDVRLILSFTAFQSPHFSFGIKVGSDSANHFNRAHAMRDCHDFLFLYFLLARPGSPLPVHGAGGIDENAIEIEQNGRAAELYHLSLLTRGGYGFDAGRTSDADAAKAACCICCRTCKCRSRK